MRNAVYFVITIGALAFAYVTVKPLVDATAASMERSAQIINNPREVSR